MANPTLADIMAKFRFLTASETSNQITDASIRFLVASFYENDLPAEFRSLKLADIYTFDTIRGIGVYAFDNVNYTTVQAPARIAKRNVYFTDDISCFNGYDTYYSQQFIQNFPLGDGTIGPYSFTTQNMPILRSVNNDPTTLAYATGRVQNILITAYNTTNTFNVTDDGVGNLVGDCLPGGMINYETGAVTNLNFTGTITPGNNISIEYLPIQYRQPISILFYQGQFSLFPIPDRGYTVEIQAYRTPNQVLLQTPADVGIPELKEWWELIAVGAAKKFYENKLDTDGIAMMDKMLFEHYAIVEARTYAQIGQDQVRTIYTDQINGGSYNGYRGNYNGY